MRQPGEGLRVLEVARMDVHRSGSDVRRWVRGKEDLDIGIRKENIFVMTEYLGSVLSICRVSADMFFLPPIFPPAFRS